MDEFTQGMVRRHTFFCVNKERHTSNESVVEAVPMDITVFGRSVHGWLITTEESVIDKIIPLQESLSGKDIPSDPE